MCLFFSSRRRHTRSLCDWSSDVCSSDLSFQRSADRLRITARVVDASSGEALAEAKADGKLEQVFELQDRIVAQFAETRSEERRVGKSVAREGRRVIRTE